MSYLPEADQVSDQVSDQVGSLLLYLGKGVLGSKALMQGLGLSHRPTFRKNYLDPALSDAWIERTQPSAARSPSQSYRLSAKGERWWRSRLATSR